MTPIDCRTCWHYADRRCNKVNVCYDGDLYQRTHIIRLYVVTEQEKPEPPRDET